MGTLVPGSGVRVDGRTLSAADVVLATGSFPRLLPGLEITERIITSDQALLLDHVPKAVVIIGAGAVGLEFASMYRSFGAEVTVLEALSRLAPLEDEEVSKELARAFRKRGIETFAGAKVQDVRDEGDHVEVTYEAGQKVETVGADACLVAVGRGPLTDGLGCEGSGVELDRGYVKVDAALATTMPRVWAVGDVAATPFQLAHAAFLEGMSVAERIAGLDVAPIDYAQIPRVTFSTPEVASVGHTEAQARERGHDVVTQKFNLQILAKANILGEGGFFKVVAEREGPVLGIHMIGPHATELVAEAMLMTGWEAMPAEVTAMIHPHPTVSEGLGEALLALQGKPLHAP